MKERQTDTRLRQQASRLRLSFIRDHLDELLERHEPFKTSDDVGSFSDDKDARRV